MQSLAGKVALVTGGSKGIGRAICFRLASQGAKVVINYSNDSSAANKVASLIGEENATVIKADAGNVEEISKLVDTTIAKYGKIDILVACTATMKLNELDNVTVTEFDQTFNLNVRGPLFLAQKSVPYMAPGSRIILFSTTQCHASTVTPNYLTYIMSKGAIEQMTRGLSKDLARKGIMVNTVAPGPTSTELFLNGKSDQLLKTIAGFNPQNRIGQPEEVAEVVAFLSSSACSWMTGQILKVNGGMA
ncbi:Brn1 [Sclerotinia sclerotiorum 1980 UF-70]|uniref:Short-chain dehydrogenase/reductase ABA4 n=2 Tax=Sclerotinia sclerotiorum (strain ATCC 18683 / 1980 / Ss-1) TaxID=665079 RepID=A7F2U7_SCLS1|nr:Brn1 [Sclerotinia sclerotiorum 1980 UF-70]APA09441.1 hypothetical protein sscle_05g042110 [Sclerotinia sclerotiorum 1980 UF-70]EDN96039.1 Brn1 [Sclerotinia sclerotiorum 1980 UF-70]